MTPLCFVFHILCYKDKTTKYNTICVKAIDITWSSRRFRKTRVRKMSEYHAERITHALPASRGVALCTMAQTANLHAFSPIPLSFRPASFCVSWILYARFLVELTAGSCACAKIAG